MHEITKMSITSLKEKQTPSNARILRSAPPKSPRAKSGNNINKGNKTEKKVPIKSGSPVKKNFWIRSVTRDKAKYQFGILSEVKSNKTVPNKINSNKKIVYHFLFFEY